ncbi:hypothetical protein RF11_16275 [Thelohanellus kitauei]|uniref:Uncharacterized protein n=1 Tax=Thelohanellus kitauei TaxID=669202 RepID=A0A0C2MYI8_THEKT|nr:hypothetical protein RF11_16275 [Thelohanellus kitauei]
MVNYHRYQAIRRSVEKFDKNHWSFTLWINTAKGLCTTYKDTRVVFIIQQFKLVDFKTYPGLQFAYLSNLKLCLPAFESARRSISQWTMMSTDLYFKGIFCTNNPKLCDL